MLKRHRPRITQLLSVLAFGRTRTLASLTWIMSHLHSDCQVPIEVLISSFWIRCSVERRLRRGVWRLQRIVLLPSTMDVAVVIQRTIVTERQLAGCYQISQRSDGSRFALIRLALEKDGRRVSTDEMLALLAEQYIALALQSAGPSLLVPIDLGPSSQSYAPHPAALRSDPLTAAHAGEHVA